MAIGRTGVVDLNNDLLRRDWVIDNLGMRYDISFWAPYGAQGDMKAIIHKEDMTVSGKGNRLTFDGTGAMVAAPSVGKEIAYGTGTTESRFSMDLVLERFRFAYDLGDAFDDKALGDYNHDSHSFAMSKLADQYMRFKDQYIFDTVQSVGTGDSASHVISTGTTFSYDDLVEIEQIIGSGNDFTIGAERPVLDPFTTYEGNDCYLFVIPTKMAETLKKDTKFQNLMSSGDVRGMNNRVINGIIGKLGKLLIVEANKFQGSNADSRLREKVAVQTPGLRRYNGTASSITAWEGESSFTSTNAVSRGVILGSNAVKLADGNNPTYLNQPSQDFNITSESALITYMQAEKTRHTRQTGEDYPAELSGIDLGIVAVDATL